MKRFIQIGIVIGAAFVLWQVSADARFLDLKKQEQAPVPQVAPVPTTQPNPSFDSEVAPQGISLRFENLSLINVLRNIQEETGILFSIDPSLETVPFSVTVQADNWEAAVNELLKKNSVALKCGQTTLKPAGSGFYQGKGTFRNPFSLTQISA